MKQTSIYYQSAELDRLCPMVYWWLTTNGLTVTKTRRSPKSGGLFIYYPTKSGAGSSLHVPPEDILSRDLNEAMNLIAGEQGKELKGVFAHVPA